GRAALQGHRHSGSEAHTELEPQGDHVALGQVDTADRGLSQELHLNVVAYAEDRLRAVTNQHHGVFAVRGAVGDVVQVLAVDARGPAVRADVVQVDRVAVLVLQTTQTSAEEA